LPEISKPAIMRTITDQKTGRKKAGIILFEGVYLLMLLAMFMLPFYIVPDYSIIRNTLSELGAQSSPASWIINSIFAALALISVISGWRCFEGFDFHRIMLILFGISLTLAAFYSQAHVIHNIHYSISVDGLHSFFASTTWMAFIILAFSTALIQEKQADRNLAISTGLSAILLSLLVSEADKTAGIWQRLLFIISFGWMIYTFRTMDN
jgi:hypothetical membrane protein